ncbi:MAG: hypothetical protein JXR71_09760 [Bacteroidales bacterium]|nr:hypothetical protein [Bacteroidales bacterium]
MARSDASIFGDFSGRIVNLVVYKLNGKTVIRIRPNTTKRKPSVLQKQNRDDFAHVMHYIRGLRQIVDSGYYDISEAHYAFHTALSANLKAYKAAGRPESAEWLKLSEGTRLGAPDLQLEALENNRYRITWGKPLRDYWQGRYDRVIIVALNNSDDSHRYTESQSTLRSQGEAILEVQVVSPGDEIYFFIFFQDVDDSLRKKNAVNVSCSQFIGTAIIAE